MEKYRNFVKIEEIRELLRQGRNEEALELTDGMDASKIKDNYDCSVLAQVYLHNGMLSKAKECFELMYKRKKTRRVAMELVNLSIRLKQPDEAENFFNEYKTLAPKDYYNLIFRYKIDRLKNKPLEELVISLEQLRQIEFFDNWGYELAKVYHKLGNSAKCVEICDEVILWFGDGEYVERAKALKAYYAGEITLKQMSEKTKAESEIAVTAEPSDEIVVPKIEKRRTQNPVGEVEDPAADMGETRVAPGGWITKEALQAAEAERAAKSAETEGTAKSAETEGTAKSAETEGTAKSAETEGTAKSAETEGTAKSAETEGTAKSAESENNAKSAEEPAKASPWGEAATSVADEGSLSTASSPSAGFLSTSSPEADIPTSVSPSDSPDQPVWDGSTEFIIGGETETAESTQAEPENLSASEDYFDAEIVKAVEDALKEENEQIKSDNQHQKENLALADENQIPDTIQSETAKTAAISDSVQEVLPEISVEDEISDTVNEALMAAVEEELGFVEETKKDQEEKKSWKQRHKEKQLERKAREAQAAMEKKQREEEEALEKKRQAEEQEAERQEAIRQEEHRREKQKAADEAARRARERMAEEAAQDNNEKESEDISADITLAGFVDEIIEADKKENETAVEIQKNEKGTLECHKPMKLSACEVPASGFVRDVLESTSTTLEEYFGFLAYKPEICLPLLSNLELLLNPENPNLSYCIIGEKGNGKKVLIQGITRLLYASKRLETKQAVWTEASKLNGASLSKRAEKLFGRCLVIERAGSLEREAITDLINANNIFKGKTSVIITDYRKNITDLLKNDELNSLFSIRLHLPSFTKDDLMALAEYKASKADYLFAADAYSVLEKKLTGISRATEEGVLARAEKYIMKMIENAEQRSAEAFLKETLEGGQHIRSNVIETVDLPEEI